MSKDIRVEKICSFCVSNWHLITMIMPYVSQKIEKENIVIFLEEDMNKNIEEFLNKLLFKEELKEKIQKLNWKQTTCKYANVKESLENNIKEKIQTNIIIFGNSDYIQKMNENVQKWMKNKDINSNVKIINAYEVMQFNNNLNEILDVHDKILNTAGIKEISEVFDGYEKKTVS